MEGTGPPSREQSPKTFRYGQRFRTSCPYRVKAGVGHLALRKSLFF